MRWFRLEADADHSTPVTPSLDDMVAMITPECSREEDVGIRRVVVLVLANRAPVTDTRQGIAAQAEEGPVHETLSFSPRFLEHAQAARMKRAHVPCQLPFEEPVAKRDLRGCQHGARLIPERSHP